MKYLFVVVFFYATALYSQQSIKLLDKQLNEPIPYATIMYGEKEGTFSNSQGIFVLDAGKDSLQISSIGYATVKMATKNVKATVFLEPQGIELKEVVIKPEKKQKLSYTSHDGFWTDNYLESYQPVIGGEIAVYIPNPNADTEYELVSVSVPVKTNTFKFDESGKKETAKKHPFSTLFKITLYQNQDNKPGIPINTKEILVNITEKEGKFKEVDLKSEHIKVPANGIYVSVAALGNADENGMLINEPSYIEKQLKEKTIKAAKPINPLFPTKKQTSGQPAYVKYNLSKNSAWVILKGYQNTPVNLEVGYKLSFYK